MHLFVKNVQHSLIWLIWVAVSYFDPNYFRETPYQDNHHDLTTTYKIRKNIRG